MDQTGWSAVRRAARWSAFKQTAVWLLVALLVGADLWLVVSEVPKHWKQLQFHSEASHIALVLSLVVLPLGVIALIARLPVGRQRTTQRYLVKPFATTHTQSSYSGAAIATLLFRQLTLLSDPGAKVNPEAAPMQASPNDMKIRIAGASVSLNWLRSHYRRIVLARPDLELEGLLDEMSEPPCLRAWLAGRPQTWSASLKRIGSITTSFDDGVTALSLAVLETMNPIRLAGIQQDRGRYRDANDLLGRQPSTRDIEVDLIQIALDCDDWSSALSRLDTFPQRPPVSQLRRWLRSAKLIRSQSLEEQWLRIEVLRARAFIAAGKYDRVIKGVECALAHGKWVQLSKHELSSQCAASYAAQQQYARASDEWRKAEREALDEAFRLLGDGPVDANEDALATLNRLVDRCVKYTGPREEVARILLALVNMFDGHASCAYLMALAGENAEYPIQVHQCRISVLDALDQLRHYDPNALSQWQAGSYRAAANAVRTLYKEDEDALQKAVEWEDVARSFYSRGIESFEETQRTDPGDILVKINLAWSYFGKGACLSQSTPGDASSPWTQPDALLLGELLAGLNEQRVDVFTASLSEVVKVSSDGAPNTGEAARRLAEQMTGELSADTMRSWHVRLADSLRSDSEGLQQSPSAATANDAGNPPSLPQILSRLLDRVVGLRGSYKLSEVAANAHREFLRRDAFARCYECFWTVFLEDEKVHEAEAQYGLACLQAVEGLTEDAISNLERSINATQQNGKPSAAYMSRARMDHDFDTLRSMGAFQELLDIQIPSVLPGVARGGVSAPDGAHAGVAAVQPAL